MTSSLLLEQIFHGVDEHPRRCLVYGVAGVGKSTFAANAPKPIFIQTEDGLRDIDTAKFPVAKTYDDVMQACYELANNEHQFKTLCVDSLDWMERLIFDAVCQEASKNDIAEFGFGKGYLLAVGYWKRFLKLVDECNEKGMNIIFIAHAKIENFNNPETEPYDRYSPDLNKHSVSTFIEYCDEILFACHKIRIDKKDQGFGKEKVTARSLDQRILRTQDQPTCIAKNRLNLPAEIPLSWDEYYKNFPANKKKESF